MHEVEFYAFDILVSDGEDLRRLPLSMRKTNLARLLARRVDGIFLSRLRAGRDRPGPVPPCLPDGAGGHGLQAPREPLSRRPVPIAGSRSRTGSIQRSAGCRISSAEPLSQERCRTSCVNLVLARPNLRVARAPARIRRPAVSLSTACPQAGKSRLVTICLYRCGDAVSRLVLPGVIHRGLDHSARSLVARAPST